MLDWIAVTVEAAANLGVEAAVADFLIREHYLASYFAEKTQNPASGVERVSLDLLNPHLDLSV
jgi:hypothetical protein